MNGPGDQTVDGVRRAALALHAVAPADRAWLLERLPRERRSEVQTLLAELASLGIPRDRTLAAAVPRKRVAEAPTPAREASPAQIAKSLDGEPTALVALALRAHDESKRDSVPPALRDALLQEVAPRLAVAANESTDPAPAKPRLPRWLRVGGRRA